LSIADFHTKDLRVGSRGININLKVAQKLEEREVVSRLDNSTHKVADLLVGDETGCIILVLWDEMIDQVKVNDAIRVENGYTSIFKGSLRLNVGRYGKLLKGTVEVTSVNTGNNLSERSVQV
jgi:replication factor A1